MQISVGLLRISTILAILAVAAISVPAAHAQTTDPITNSAQACANVKPPVPNPQDTIDDVPVYVIPASARGQRAVCLATEALAEGMVAASVSDDVVLAAAEGDPAPETDIGQVSETPYLLDFPYTGLHREDTDTFHGYAAFIDPATGVEYEFSDVAQTLAEIEDAGAQWIQSTVVPLMEHSASAAPKVLAFAAAADATVGTANYDPIAWNLLVVKSVSMPTNEVARGTVVGLDREMGQTGAVVRVYRLNGKGADDYFLVDTAYTQTPTYAPFTTGLFNLVQGYYWANFKTRYKLTSVDINHPNEKPKLDQWAPKTPITETTTTLTVGGSLTTASAGVSGGYSVTTKQQSVETSSLGTLNQNTLEWNDVYKGFSGDFQGPPPSTSTQTFTGERLAIFRVPSTVNDVKGAGTGARAGLFFDPVIRSDVQGYFIDPFITGTHKNYQYAGWNASTSFFAAEPQFDASPRAVTVSKTKNAHNAVIVNVIAQLPDGGEKVTWRPQVQNNGLEVNVVNGKTGNGELTILPTASAVTGFTTKVLLDTVPPGATNSVRDGPIEITVKIEN